MHRRFVVLVVFLVLAQVRAVAAERTVRSVKASASRGQKTLALADIPRASGQSTERSMVTPTARPSQDNERWYVVMAPLSDKGASLDPELVKLIEDQMRNRIAEMGGVLVLSTQLQAKGSAGAQKKRYYVQVQVEPVSNGGLKMGVLCFSYPRRSLLGEIHVKAAGPRRAELVRVLAPRAVDEAADTFHWRL